MERFTTNTGRWYQLSIFIALTDCGPLIAPRFWSVTVSYWTPSVATTWSSAQLLYSDTCRKPYVSNSALWKAFHNAEGF
jgi:hypothetical protein